ncbi:MAG TPA: ribose 5-phosphate isomerase B [Clostridiales bacterium]|nr:ribose 5-phosphate isomerase B [Clostridiales bacterium]
MIAYLHELGFETKDFGAMNAARTHYPIYGQKVARAVASGECEKGIVICGTGIGIGMAANKTNGIRCAICSEPYSAMMSRAHNNANMLAFGARVVGGEVAKLIVKTFLETEYEGGRHQQRVDMLRDIEQGIDISET